MSIIISNDVMPITQKGVRSLSQMDYGTCDRALSELIDNSWEVGYCTTRSDIIGHFANGKRGLTSIDIIDNGPGMSIENLDKCLTIGSETEKTSQTRGTYGMGLKSASLWCGRDVTILTKCEDGPLLKATFGMDNGRIIESVDDATSYEKFSKMVGGHHGTVVKITNINSYRFPKTKKAFIENISRGHGMIFSKFLKDTNAEMYVNNERITPVEYVNTEVSTRMSPEDAVWEYTGVDGVKKKIHYEAWFTPKNDESDMFLPRNQENQGFICVRNGRMTGKGLTFGIVAKNNIYNGCKIILYLDGSTDTDFGVSFGKTQRGHIVDDDIMNSFTHEFKKYFELAKKYQNERVEKGETTREIDNAIEQVQKELAENLDLQEALDALKCNSEADGTKGTNKKNDNNDNKPEVKAKEKTDTEKKRRKPRDGSKVTVCGKTIRFFVENMGANSYYFQPDYSEKGEAICRVNSEHNYYKNFMYGRPQNANVDIFRGFACEWLSVYGADVDKSSEAIEQYQKRLLVKSRAMASLYRNKIEDDVDA